jgi:photosynthetic reaction center cytochrome c subunit
MAAPWEREAEMADTKTRSQLRDEVTGLLLRGGLYGLIAFALALAFMAVPRLIGGIWPTESVQTGFRGTGMAVPEFVSDVAELEIENVAPGAAEPPVPPAPGDQLAGDVYENAGPLAHLTVANYDRLVDAMRTWVGHPDLFAEGELNYQTEVAYRMIQMTWAINSDWDGHVQATGVTCYTCHRGNNVPLNVWNLPEPHSDWAGPSAMYQNRAVAANYSTALPIDALRTYLLEDEQPVGVHGYSARDTDGTSNASIYHTYQTFALMMHFSSSLGVNCTYCHNTRSPADPEGFTPQWAVAQLGRAMVQEINNVHILPTQELLPPERLGPQGDVAKANCTTCHQGAAKPLLGQSMLGDWPELASSEPVYE